MSIVISVVRCAGKLGPKPSDQINLFYFVHIVDDMEFPPLDPTDYVRLGMRKYKKSIVYTSKYHWKAARDREFCLLVLDEKRLSVIGLPDPQDTANRDQTWIYTKGEGWAKSTPMPKKIPARYFQGTGSGCDRITTKADCEEAARIMGLSDTVASEETSTSFPKYCYYYQGKTLWFNKGFDSPVQCSSTHPCICGKKWSTGD